MNVYLVRRGHDRVVAATLSRREAIALVNSNAQLSLEKNREYPVESNDPNTLAIEDVSTGFKSKVHYRSVIRRTPTGGFGGFVDEFWVQQHHLRMNPLELLAEQAE